MTRDHRDIRHPLDDSIQMTLLNSINTEACNISNNGIMLRSPYRFGIDTTLVLDFTLPLADRERRVKTHAVVRWQQEKDGWFYLGIYFNDLKKRYRRCIEDYIDELPVQATPDRDQGVSP